MNLADIYISKFYGVSPVAESVYFAGWNYEELQYIRRINTDLGFKHGRMSVEFYRITKLCDEIVDFYEWFESVYNKTFKSVYESHKLGLL